MTYNVFGGTLNPTLLLLFKRMSTKLSPCSAQLGNCDKRQTFYFICSRMYKNVCKSLVQQKCHYL